VGHNLYTYHHDPDGQIVELFAEQDQMSDEAAGAWDPRPWHHETPLRPPAVGDGPLPVERLGHSDATGLPGRLTGCEKRRHARTHEGMLSNDVIFASTGKPYALCTKLYIGQCGSISSEWRFSAAC